MKIFILAIIAVVLALVIRPLTVPGFFPIHDDTQVSRVYEMQKALDDGMFPVRWAKDLGYGYGYPIFNFYAPLSYYVGGAMSFFGVDPLNSTKMLFALALIFSAINMYFLGNLLWGKWGGLISSVLYLLSPYNAVNLFVRGNLSEIWGYAFIPLFFYGLFGIYKKSKARYIFVTSLGFSAIILSHNLTALITVLFFAITLIYFFFSSNKKVLKYSILGFLLGLLIASFYFLPALFEAGYTNVQSQIGGGADFRNHFVCVAQLWDSPWGFGGSAPGCLDGLSFRVGKLHLLLAALFLFIILRKKTKDSLNFLVPVFFLTSIFFMLDISRPVWEFIKPMAFIQYPWRFLTFASFSTSLMGGGVIYLFNKSFKKVKYLSFIYSLIIILIAFFLYLKLFVPQTILDRSSSYYTSTSNLNFIISKISDEYLPKNIQIPRSENDIQKEVSFLKGSGKIVFFDRKTNSIKTFIDSNTSSVILFRLSYFPSWKAYVDGKETVFNKDRSGMVLALNPGAHDIKIYFKETPVEELGNFLSLSGITLLILGTIYAKKNRLW